MSTVNFKKARFTQPLWSEGSYSSWTMFTLCEQSREPCNQHNNTVEDLDRWAHNGWIGAAYLIRYIHPGHGYVSVRRHVSTCVKNFVIFGIKILRLKLLPNPPGFGPIGLGVNQNILCNLTDIIARTAEAVRSDVF